jgi:hypothetical protein
MNQNCNYHIVEKMHQDVRKYMEKYNLKQDIITFLTHNEYYHRIRKLRDIDSVSEMLFLRQVFVSRDKYHKYIKDAKILLELLEKNDL